MRQSNRSRTPQIVIIALIASMFFMDACWSGQRSLPTPQAQMAPLPSEWKEMVYNEMTKHATAANKEQNIRFLFLDAPVPCTIRVGKKGFMAFGTEIKQGYGGVVLRKMVSGTFFGKRTGVDKDAMVCFYIIEADGGKISHYSHEQLEYSEVMPPIITVETTYGRNSKQIELKAAILDPVLQVEAAAFRAISDVKTFDSWPPYK